MKRLDAWQDSLTYTMTGNGRFPVDMLRYDRAVPNTEKDSMRITAAFKWNGGDPVSVTLRALKPPTVGRWASYGWHLTKDGE